MKTITPVLIRLAKVAGIALLIIMYIFSCGLLAIKFDPSFYGHSNLVAGLIVFIPLTFAFLGGLGLLLFLINWLIVAPVIYIITGEYEGL